MVLNDCDICPALPTLFIFEPHFPETGWKSGLFRSAGASFFFLFLLIKLAQTARSNVQRRVGGVNGGADREARASTQIEAQLTIQLDSVFEST